MCIGCQLCLIVGGEKWLCNIVFYGLIADDTRLNPADTLRNNDVIITSKRRLTSFWRYNDVIITSIECSGGLDESQSG